MVLRPICIDDTIWSAKTFTEFLEKTRKVFECFREANLNLNPEKTTLGRSKIEFLSFEIDGQGIRPYKSKVDIIDAIPLPKNVRSLKAYLGALLYYKAHIVDMSRTLAPLYNLTIATKEDAKKSKYKTISWNEECVQAFKKVKSY